MMVSPGIYHDLSMEQYLKMPAVSASLLKTTIDACPFAAWFQSWMNTDKPPEPGDRAMNAGTIAHGILLEGSTAGVAVVDPADHPAEKTGAIPEGWTNKSIRAARDAAIASGKIPVLAPQMIEIEAMVSAARAYIESLRDSEPAIWAAFQSGGGESEVTMVWEDGETLCRIRPDRISADRRLIVDYKTGGTTAEPDTWGRTQMVRMGYYTSAAFYRRGVQALCNVTPDYVFLVQEQEAPYLCSLVGIDPQGYDLGARRIGHGIGVWTGCMKSGRWPAYPNRVCYAEIPPWEAARWEGRDAGDSLGIPYEASKLWSKPEKLGFEHEHDPV